MRRAIAITAALAAVMLAAPASASAFELTHRVKISVEYSYDWSLSPEGSCGRSGSGFFRTKVSTKSVRVLPGFSAEANRFMIAVPHGKTAAKDLPRQRLLGNYEVANNAPWVGPCAEENNANDRDRSACGVKPLPKGASAGYTDSSRSRMEIVVGGLPGPFERKCRQPGVFDLDGLFKKQLFIKVPSKKQLDKDSVTVEGRQTVQLALSKEGGAGTANGVRIVRFVFTKR